MTTSENKIYKKALSYAFYLDPFLFKDIVHDSFLRWFDKTHLNLFDEPERTVISVVKKTWWSKYIQPNKFMYRGEINNRQKVQFSDEMKYNSVTPEDELIAKELNNHMMSFKPQIKVGCNKDFIENSARMQLDIYLFAVQGYTRAEISEEMNLTVATISNYFKRMQWRASLFN